VKVAVWKPVDREYVRADVTEQSREIVERSRLFELRGGARRESESDAERF
jgi:hypothetical protein